MLVRDPVTQHTTFARVKVPKEMLPRFVALDDDELTFVALEDVIATTSTRCSRAWRSSTPGIFRVTRDADFEVSDEADDLLQAVEAELRRRRFGEVVRVEVDAGMNPQLRERDRARAGGRGAPGLRRRGPARPDRPVADRRSCRASASCATRRGRRSPSRGCRARRASRPTSSPRCATATCSSTTPTTRSSTSVERFVEQAVDDPDVLAIKQTVYRTSEDSPLVPALIRATERGKQAVCLVELKARFDERANIELGAPAGGGGRPRRLRPPGAQDARQVHPRRAPRGRRRAPLRARRHRQLPPGDRAPVHRLRAVHRRRARSAPTSPTCSTSSPATRGPARYRKVLVAPEVPARRRSSTRSTRRSRPRSAASDARIAHEDERARRPRSASRRCTARRRPACRSTSTSAASAACAPGVPGREREHPRRLDRRALPRALADLRLRAQRRARASTSARPT